MAVERAACGLESQWGHRIGNTIPKGHSSCVSQVELHELEITPPHTTPLHIHVYIHSSRWSSALLKQRGERLSSATGCCCWYSPACVCSVPHLCDAHQHRVHGSVGNTASASALELQHPCLSQACRMIHVGIPQIAKEKPGHNVSMLPLTSLAHAAYAAT